jgi:hypothetical protein
MDAPTDSYALWALAFGVPAVAVGALNDAVAAGGLAAVVLAAVAYLYFNYPF